MNKITKCSICSDDECHTEIVKSKNNETSFNLCDSCNKGLKEDLLLTTEEYGFLIEFYENKLIVLKALRE